MKRARTAGSLGAGVVAAILAAKGPALVAVAAVVLILGALVVGAACWVVNNRDRAANTVDLIAAARGDHRQPSQDAGRDESRQAAHSQARAGHQAGPDLGPTAVSAG